MNHTVPSFQIWKMIVQQLWYFYYYLHTYNFSSFNCHFYSLYYTRYFNCI